MQPLPVDLETRQLLRRLCRRIAGEVITSSRADPDLIDRLQPQLEDTAHSVLLGLHPEAAPQYVAPDEREQQVAQGVAAAAHQLRLAGYPGLARDLEAARGRLESCGTFQLLGSVTERETGAVPTLPLTQHASLLGLLLGLAGTRPSLRQQRFSFQTEQLPRSRLEAAPDGGTAAGPAVGVPLLSSRVFEEAPVSHALSDGPAAVAVLLPGELGLPTEAYAGSDDVQDLALGLDSRPVWQPTAAAALPPPASAAWLAVPPSLLQLQRDGRRAARPGPLGLPRSLLSMDDAPGSCTLFSPDAADDWGAESDGGDAASADSVHPQDPGLGGASGGCDARLAQAAAAADAAEEQHVGLSCQLWSLAEADLARQALLALQGVASSLLSLQALLAAPAALPRPSVLGLLQRLAAAGELRLRLHDFAAAFGSGASGRRLGGDPTQQAFATAVSQVLQRQSAALQQLEQQQASSWVEAVAVGGVPGRRFHGQAPTLLQVALHTRRLQLQLASLADLCWCRREGGVGEDASPGGAAGASGEQRAWLWQQGYPAGTQLLDYLYRRANEADDADARMLRFLFVQACQPYLRHMHAWAFTTHAVSREFGTAGDKELLTLDFLPPPEHGDVALVPVDPPAFLQPLHAAFMRAGSQLRLLHSLERHGRGLARQLAGIAEGELTERRAGAAAPEGAAGVEPATAHSDLSFSLSDGPAVRRLSAAAEEAWQPWISLACNSSLPGGGSLEDGGPDLQMSSSGLRQAVHVSQERDDARAAAVGGWLGGLALQRRLAEHAAAAEQLGRAAAFKEEAAERAARQAAALSRQQSGKASLLQEQAAALAERRTRRAAEQAQQEANDRQLQAAAAQRYHALAVAELEQALGHATVRQPPTLAAGAEQQPGAGTDQRQEAGQPAAAEDAAPAVARLPAGLPLPPLKLQAMQRHVQQQHQENTAPAEQGGAGWAAPPASSRQQPALPLAPPSGLAAMSTPPLLYGASAVLQHQLSLAAAAPPGEHEGGEADDGGGDDGLAPLSAVLELSVTHSVLSQYRAVSRACVRLFLDEYKILDHLEALRRFFFQGAGDWAEALVARLGAHADSLRPLASHHADAILEDAVRGSSVEEDPYSAHLRIKMLPAAGSAIQAQVAAIHSPTPTRRARSYWSSHNTVQLAPTHLDALDCITLDYRVGWPLNAILTEDTLQGYSAVFSMMTRLRRTEQLLRALAPPLAAQARSSADLLLSEDDADRAHRRVQALRAFRFGAAQFVASLQAFLRSRTSGDAWVHLLAKLMVSSEEVAATLVSRQPSAPMTGLLSRMNSLGPTGKAAHKLAQQMASALGSSSLPGSPRPAAGAAGGGQLSRFNSLLSAAASVASAAGSAVSTPRDGAPPLTTARQLSRFASRPTAAAAGDAARNPRPAASGAGSPTAASAAPRFPGAPLSTQLSPAERLLGQAAAQAGGDGGHDPDAAVWAEQLQRSQQGISDLQELLLLHRRYIQQASEDCLTFGGSEAVRLAVEGCLQCLVAFAFRLQGTVRSGMGRRAEETWTQSLRLDDAWGPLAAGMADFEARVQQLQGLLADASSKSVLAELQLDFNGFYAARQKKVQRRQSGVGPARRQSVAA